MIMQNRQTDTKYNWILKIDSFYKLEDRLIAANINANALVMRIIINKSVKSIKS